MRKFREAVLEPLKNGLFTQNPLFIQLLGTCPTLATTTNVKNAVGMGLSVTAVLICSNVFISLLRKMIPKQVRIAAYIVIISGFVTAVEMLLAAYLPALSASLGVFIPLIVVNCIILARAEAFASKNPVLPSALDGLSMGLGFTGALCLVAAVRELFGAGTLYGYPVLGSHYQPMLMFLMPCGAFITVGCLMAAFRTLVSKAQNAAQKRAEKKEQEEPQA